MHPSQALINKIDQARMVLEEAFDTYPTGELIIAWSGGKDSTLLLHLALEVCRTRGLSPPRVLDIDQGDAFPEIVEFRDRLIREWGLDLMLVANHDLLDKVSSIGDQVAIDRLDDVNRTGLQQIGYTEPTVAWIPGTPACTYLLKTLPVAQAIVEHRIAGMMTGIRWDEQVARRNETYFSERANPPHMRIHPLLHFTERDVWDATFALEVPFNSLYREGYRSLDSRTASVRLASVPAWEQDLEAMTERAGRDPEKEKLMAQLRDWGYM